MYGQICLYVWINAHITHIYMQLWMNVCTHVCMCMLICHVDVYILVCILAKIDESICIHT